MSQRTPRPRAKGRSPRQCTLADGSGKHVFESRAQAAASRRFMNGTHVKVYWCPEHHGWHLGRNPERRQP